MGSDDLDQLQHTWEDLQQSLSSKKKARVLNLEFSISFQKYEIQFLELFRSLSKTEQHPIQITSSLALANPIAIELEQIVKGIDSDDFVLAPVKAVSDVMIERSDIVIDTVFVRHL